MNMEWLFTRPTVITLAVLGGAVSLLASTLQARGTVSEQRARQMQNAAYGCMAASMLLFIIAGFKS
jgi:hypothetical protein